MTKSKRQECFVNGHCCYDCPNFEIQTADERYGYGIAEDMGLEEVKCKNCYHNSGECKDCLLKNSPDCPKYRQEPEAAKPDTERPEAYSFLYKRFTERR